MASSIFSAGVIFTGRDRGLKTVMNTLRGAAERLPKPIREIGSAGILMGREVLRSSAVAVGAITAVSTAAFLLTKSVATAGDEIAKTAQKIGVGVVGLQEWRFAAERSGVATNVTDLALQRLGRRMGEVAQFGTGEAKKAFDALGISITTTSGRVKTLEEVLPELADSLGQIDDISRRNALAVKLFDSEGLALINVLSAGSAGIREMVAEGRELGLFLGKEATEESQKFAASLQSAQGVLTGVKNIIGIELIPVVGDLLDRFRAFVIENQPRLRLFAQEVAAGLPGALKTIRTEVSGLIDDVRPAVRFVGDLVEQFGAAEVAVGAFSAVALVALAPAIGIVTTSVIALTKAMFANPLFAAASIGSAIATPFIVDFVQDFIAAGEAGREGAAGGAASRQRRLAGQPSAGAALAAAQQAAGSGKVALDVNFSGLPSGARVEVEAQDNVDTTVDTGEQGRGGF